MEQNNKLIQPKNKKHNKKTRIGGITSAFLVSLVIVFTFLKTPEEITATLENIASSLSTYFLIVHGILIVALVTGLVISKYRKYIFFGAMLFLSLSATGVSIAFFVIPNIIFFALISVLLIIAFIQKKVNFELKHLKFWDILFAVLGIGFGFWYLHWVQDPLWLNVLLYSPLGGVNCPTLVMLSGYLCLSDKPRKNNLEITVAVLTVYFGFFGIFRLQAYIDIVLILCGGYLLTRNLSRFIKRPE